MEQHTSQRSWDRHFMREAKLWATRSKCLSRKVGAVLVQGRHVTAVGYNGPAKGIPHCDYRDDSGQYVAHHVSDICPRRRMGFPSGEGMEHCVAIHAEINPILQAARMNLSTVGTTLYTLSGTPCLNCTKELIQAGVKRIVCLGKSGSSYGPIKDGDNPTKKDYNFPLAEKLLELAGVELDVIPEEEVTNGPTNPQIIVSDYVFRHMEAKLEFASPGYVSAPCFGTHGSYDEYEGICSKCGQLIYES